MARLKIGYANWNINFENLVIKLWYKSKACGHRLIPVKFLSVWGLFQNVCVANFQPYPVSQFNQKIIAIKFLKAKSNLAKSQVDKKICYSLVNYTRLRVIYSQLYFGRIDPLSIIWYLTNLRISKESLFLLFLWEVL